MTLPYLHGHHDECEQLTRDALGDRAYGEAFRTGAEMSLDESIAYALGDRQHRQAPDDTGRIRVDPARNRGGRSGRGGPPNKEIASTLVISPRTAQGHVEHVLSKLGFTSRTQIAAWIAENQLDRQH